MCKETETRGERHEQVHVSVGSVTRDLCFRDYVLVILFCVLMLEKSHISHRFRS